MRRSMESFATRSVSACPLSLPAAEQAVACCWRDWRNWKNSPTLRLQPTDRFEGAMCDPPVVVDVVDLDRERWFVGTILANGFSMRTIFLVST